jgi:hypothetical protein
MPGVILTGSGPSAIKAANTRSLFSDTDLSPLLRPQPVAAIMADSATSPCTTELALV